MPPKASPNTHTTRPQPTLAPPATRDQYPLGATSRKTPRPIWIHTVAAAADTGRFDQMVAPTLAMCWTHPGDELAAGVSTVPGRPNGIDAWAWSRPSNTQSTPK